MLTRYSRLVCFTLLLLSILGGSIPVRAQEITGSISGTVKDSSGAAVAGATVLVKDTDKNIVVRTLSTNSDGTYSAPLLPIGHYSISVEATGFKRYTKAGVELNVNDRLSVDAVLEVGGTNEEVVIQAPPVQVELQSASATGLISGIEVRELPLNNRNFIQLTTLMPGVSSGLTD